jgi:immunity protein 22 of polymorphic toxin system
MEEQGTVSLWIGRAPSEAALDAAVEVSSSEDGDFLGCDFSRAFGIDYFDQDYIEAVYREKSSTDLAELLKGASYHEVIIDRFRAIGQIDEPVSCLILLFNFRHDGSVRSAGFGDGVSMRFLGAVSYE